MRSLISDIRNEWKMLHNDDGCKTRLILLLSRACAAGLGMAFLLTASSALADKAEDQFNFATGLFIEGDYELASNEYKAFLGKYSQHKLAGDAQFQLGESLMRLEQFKDALPAFDAYVKRNDTEQDKLAAAYFRRSKARAALGENEKAAEHYQAFAQKFPTHELAPAARYWVGECLLRAGKLPEAKTAFETALKLKRGDAYEPYCEYGLGCSLQALNKHAEAAPHFEAVVQRFAKEEFAPDAALKLAECYDSLGRHDDALKAYDVLQQKFAGKLSVELLMGRAWAFYHKGELEKAEPLFTRVAKEHPEHPMAQTASYNAASALFNLGKHKDALPRFGALADAKGEYALPSMYWKGRCLLKLDKAKESVGLFQTVAGKEGEYQANAQFALGDAFYQLGDLENAAKAYEALAQKLPKHDLADDALQAAATVSSEKGDNDRAFALATRLIQQYPKSPLKDRAQFLAGESLFRQDKFPQADAAFKAILNGKAEGVEKDVILYKLAWCAAGQKQLDPASKLFQRLVKEYPKSKLAAESLYMAGKLVTDLGRHKDARALYVECIRSYAGQPAAENAAYAIALAFFSEQNWKQASAGFESFIKSHPKSELQPVAWFYLAESRLADGDYPGGRAAYDTVVQKHPQSEVAPQAAYGRAWCFREQEELQKAAAAFEEAAAKFPKAEVAGQALFWGGRCKMELGEWQAAKSLFTKAATAPGADKLKADIKYSTAHCMLREEKYDGAINTYNAFLKEFPNSPQKVNALYDLAWAYLGKKDEKRALDYFQQVVGQANDAGLKADALFRLGEARYAEKKYDQAAQFYSQITALDAALESVDFVDKAYYKLGWSQEKLGKKQEALQAYQKVAEKNPDSDVAADATLRAALMLKEMGKYANAAKALQALVAKPGLDKALLAKARFHLAESLRSLKRWGEALNNYRILTQPNAGFEPVYHVYYGLGACAFEVNALADASSAFSRVIELTETETAARAQLALGEIFAREKKYDEAGREFLRLHILYSYPQWKTRGLLRAAQCFRQGGKKERAAKYLKVIVDKFPKSKEAPEARKLLGN